MAASRPFDSAPGVVLAARLSKSLVKRGAIASGGVASAFARVDRAAFCPSSYEACAWDDVRSAGVRGAARGRFPIAVFAGAAARVGRGGRVRRPPLGAVHLRCVLGLFRNGPVLVDGSEKRAFQDHQR